MNENNDTNFEKQNNGSSLGTELEARIVAWVAGEASAFEAAELDRLAADRPEVAAFKRAIEAAHALATEAVKPDPAPLRMSEGRRAKLLAALGAASPKSAQANAGGTTVVVLPQPSGRSRKKTYPVWWTTTAAAFLIAGFLAPSLLVYEKKPARPDPSMTVLGPSGSGSALVATAPVVLKAEQEMTLVARERAGEQASVDFRYAAYPDSAKQNVTAPDRAVLEWKNFGSASDKISAGDAIDYRLPSASSATLNRVAQSDAAIPTQNTLIAGANGAVWPANPSGIATGGTANIDVGGFYASTVTDTNASLLTNFSYGSAQGPLVLKKPDLNEVGVLLSADGVRPGAITLSQTGVSVGQSPLSVVSGTARPDSARTSGSDITDLDAVRPLAVVSTAGAVAQSDGMTVANVGPAPGVAGSGYISTPPISLGNQFAADAERPLAKASRARNAASASTQTFGSEQLPTLADGTLREAPAEGSIVSGSIDLSRLPSAVAARPAMPNYQFEIDSIRGAARNEAVPRDRTDADDRVFKREPSKEALTANLAVISDPAPLSFLTPPAQTPAAPAPRQLSQAKDLPASAPVTVAGIISLPAPGGLAPVAEKKKEAPTSDETTAAREPVSTFSLHVSDVSFRLLQNTLAATERGENPTQPQLRAEEIYNAFDYGDPVPSEREKVAARIEQSAHPVLQQRNLVRIALRVAATGRAATQPLRLTVLLDTSGSMEREDRRAAVRRAMAELVALLGPQDRITLIGFARQPRLLAVDVPGNQASNLVALAASTPPDGGTNLEAALQLAREQALRLRQPGAQNRIVLLTDGAANLGDAEPARLTAVVEALRQEGIAFDACGVGLEGTGDTTLEALTRKGDGRYYVLDRPETADATFARKLAGAFRPAAENVKLQVRFNPARVGNYRLIGFEKHRLREEDFRNDRVDAAELSAEEAAVALYQVEPLPQGTGELGEVSVRFRDPATGEMVERTWPILYEASTPAFDRASPAMQLAGTAAMIAEVATGSAVGQQVRLGDLAPVVNALRSHFPQQTRVQELTSVYAQLRKLKRE